MEAIREKRKRDDPKSKDKDSNASGTAGAHVEDITANETQFKIKINFSTESYTFLRTKSRFLKVNFILKNLCLHSWQTLCRVTLICSLQWCHLLSACCLPSWPSQHQFFSRRQLSCVVFGIIFFILKRAHKKPARTCIIFFLLYLLSI